MSPAAAARLTAGLLAGSLLALAGRPATAQGPAPPSGPAEFKSPMVLETEFTAHAPGTLGRPVSIGEWATSLCEGVSIRTLRVRAEERAPTLAIDLKAGLHTESGKDKLVDIRFELRSGERTLGEAWIRKINAEEDEDAAGRTTMKVPLADIPPGSSLILRATVHVREN